MNRTTRGVLLAASLLAGLASAAALARGDAIVVTKAMQASTIAQIFVDRNRARVELEIAPADWQVFQDLLPDRLYAKLSNDKLPLAKRQQRFFKNGFVLRNQEGAPLVGSVEKTEVRWRLVRDEVTGEPLAEQPSDSQEILYVVLQYEIKDPPTRLSLEPPLVADSQLAAANIGFVCYHEGLPVNDFRYLPGKVTLELDWTDPWFSRFGHVNLRREFDAPLSVYLYVEPYEVRQEVIVRPKDMQSWIELEIAGKGVIPVDQQAELKERVAKFLLSQNPVTIDGKLVQGRLDRIHFIRRTLRRTGIIEPAVELDATSATLGVIIVYPIDKLPEEVSMRWDLFSPKIQEIPAVASDEAGGLPSRVTSEDATLIWRNYLTHPTTHGLASVALPPSPREFSLPVISVLCGALVVFLLGHLLRSEKGAGNHRAGIVVAMIGAVIVGVLTLPLARIGVANLFAQPPAMSQMQAKDLVTSLLHNVYRAFDHHDESLIYDRLSSSIAGDLLEQVYLGTRRSMEVKNQGGLRISVKDVVVEELTLVSQTSQQSLTFRCRWRVGGWIGHWGHIHQRVNEHQALITIAPLDGQWKITALEMIDERQIEEFPTAKASQQASLE